MSKISFSDWYADLLRIGEESSPANTEMVRGWDIDDLKKVWEAGTGAREFFDRQCPVVEEDLSGWSE